MLASTLFPYDDDAPELIDGWLSELEREGCVLRYEVDGASYIEIRNWRKHQKIEKPSASRFPQFTEGSPKLHEVLGEDLVLGTEVPSTKITIDTESVPAVDAPREDPSADHRHLQRPQALSAEAEDGAFPSSDDLRLAIQHWNFRAEQIGLAQVRDFTNPRRRWLKARLSRLGNLDEWIALVDSLEHRPFCRGDNKRGWRIDFDFMVSERGFTKIIEGNWLKPGMEMPNATQ